MFKHLIQKIVGTKNERELTRLRPRVQAISALEPEMQRLSDADFRAKTAALRERVAQAAGGNGDTQAVLEEILPEAFAVCREAARRVLNMRHFDVQLIGGMVLHEGKIAEMATGEGKTLVATLPVYLNALTGKGVHLVTVNDYLAKRDTQWMGPIYHALGLSVGVLQHEASSLFDPTVRASDMRMANLRPCSRQEAYRADVTYGTNSEFGFDYLRDNMKFSAAEFVQREMHYAIVDEVDNILIDEARTPLIISGPSEESTDKYYTIDRIIPRLKRAATITSGKLHEIEATATGDYIVDEKARTVALTETGVLTVEKLLGVKNLYEPANIDIVHHVQQGLRAHTLYKRDVDYVVKDGEVIIVDEFTGRLMPGRRWSDGLHQAVEAREKVKIERENQTLASITIQNYFRMYGKLAGMTGTADTEAAEFAQIYNLDVVVVPTNQPLVRQNHNDVVYKTQREKLNAVADEIAELHKIGRPVLVGTTSIEKSEAVSALLKRRGIPHQVLNAKPMYAEREAEVVAQAGRLKAMTISTNMAGRGTDILLGGTPKFMATDLVRRGEVSRDGLDPAEYERVLAEVRDMQRYGLLETDDPESYAAALARVRKQTEAEHQNVVELGGLHILATERHEARRIDNQLRGRAGRQGDPGSSRFYLSLEDDLLRLFAQERIAKIMDKLGMEEGEPIEHPWVTRAIETAQKRVEAHNFEIRKHLLEYDDVMNTQRKIIYGERRQLLEGEDIREVVEGMLEEVLDGILDLYTNEETYPEEWDMVGLAEAVKRQFDLQVSWTTEEIEGLTRVLLKDDLLQKTQGAYRAKEAQVSTDMMRYLERMILLQVVDSQWKDHLLAMDHLKEGIGLRGYGQKDPLIEYKREGFEMFEAMEARIAKDALEYLMKVQVAVEPERVAQAADLSGLPLTPLRTPSERRREREATPSRSLRPAAAPAVAAPRAKVGRNEPCPCGSGKKYKKCCGH
ncbi:MAG: preprotein translocase subunit SecA [candidate division NC10 bacterium RIFCSPLOWO2_12_FULL_66_18]|nr:MAG: preprotein translocase subunit SecA [candidate division NC10 bacterium RIFCSPLOWO2_12_FULL_66_18]